MDAIRGLLHDGFDGLPEALDLPPQWLQTGHVVVQVDRRHLRAWMHLGEGFKNILKKGTEWQRGEQINRSTVIKSNTSRLKTLVRCSSKNKTDPEE